MEDEYNEECSSCGSEMHLCEECTNCPEHCLCDEDE